jgi:DEAD/DEAH box helicase domain-containing protein
VLAQFLTWLSNPPGFLWSLCHHEIIPEKKPDLRPIPEGIHPDVIRLLKSSGFAELYSHQAESVSSSLQEQDVVLCTSTASGKTLSYQIPILDTLIRNPNARSLFLFPLKALERDQKDSFLSIAKDSGLTAGVYDGDTPEAERRKIRMQPPRVLITNPDMLHLGLLAFHETWKEFFGNLTHIVLDEVHTYKGIFGSHISQVLLRVLRVCRLYGSNPLFFTCSATIANPAVLMKRLTGRDFRVVDVSGAPSSDRHFLLVDPVSSPYTAAAEMFAAALKCGLKTIVFTKARKITELITRWVLQSNPHLKSRISSYRAGFLPEERREIESKLFSGEMDGVISTSALEMGIDVGGLDLCILVGYPGTIINTWQRGGRVGRAGRPSAIVLLAGHDALDKYFLRNPTDLFKRNCEEAILDPYNREVLKKHIPCAASETPISPQEEWTGHDEIKDVLAELEDEGILYRPHKESPWSSSAKRPHRTVDLRGIGTSFPIFLDGTKSLIGNSAGKRVFTECHEGAVYLHKAREYLVTKLDLERKIILVKPERLNYYTRALSEKDTEILRAPLRSNEFPGYIIREANLKVTERIHAYEKRRVSSQELISVTDLELPPLHFETVGIWIEIPETVRSYIQDRGLGFMGGIHAMEHAAISMFPLFALCDRDDIGGISTPDHPQVCKPAVFIYDGHPGGVGLSHRAFDIIDELLRKTLTLVETCPCEDGCPSCIHSPKCGSGNKPLDKQACILTLKLLLEPDTALKKPVTRLRKASERQRDSAIAPELKAAPFREDVPDKKTKPRIFPELAARVLSRERPIEPARVSCRTSPPVSCTGGPESESLPGSQTKIQCSPGLVVFDIETQKLANEVGGWRNVRKMKVALAVAYCENLGFLTFREEQTADLINLLLTAPLIVGFNHMRFDYEVLSAYTREDLRALPNLDILACVESSLGFRLPLDHLSEVTLGRNKSGHGTEAVTWFREGRMDLIEKYCRDDVCLTRDLYKYGLENGYLLYKRKDRRICQIPLNWASGPLKK